MHCYAHLLSIIFTSALLLSSCSKTGPYQAPLEVPLYPSARDVTVDPDYIHQGSRYKRTVFTTPDSPEAVTAWYAQELPRYGWEDLQIAGPSHIALTAMKGCPYYLVNVQAVGDASSLTTVTVLFYTGLCS